MEQPPENLAFWLLPAASEKTFFASLIRDLALRFDAPRFEPHLTLLSSDVTTSAALAALRNVAVQASSSYELEVDGVDVSESFTKTLFVRFTPSRDLGQLRAAIGDALELSNAVDFDPHLSLLYKQMPLSEKTKLAKEIPLPFRAVTFTGLSLIAHPPEIKAREDIEVWRTIGYRSLVESSR